MSKTLLAGSALALFMALAACSRQPAADDAPAAPRQATPAQPASAPVTKPATEQAALTGDGGAYGMPRAPIPYDQLDSYEHRQGAAGGAPDDDRAGAAPPRRSPYREPSKRLNPKTRRESDMVFY
jgi:hypothetical protein